VMDFDPGTVITACTGPVAAGAGQGVWVTFTKRSRPRPCHQTRGPPRGAEAAVRQLRVVSWGLVPSWAPNPGVAGRFINARMETVTEKPAYRRAFAARRCLLPAYPVPVRERP
jgi:SOS response associated peptidase (SRAP)